MELTSLVIVIAQHLEQINQMGNIHSHSSARIGHFLLDFLTAAIGSSLNEIITSCDLQKAEG